MFTFLIILLVSGLLTIGLYLFFGSAYIRKYTNQFHEVEFPFHTSLHRFFLTNTQLDRGLPEQRYRIEKDIVYYNFDLENEEEKEILTSVIIYMLLRNNQHFIVESEWEIEFEQERNRIEMEEENIDIKMTEVDKKILYVIYCRRTGKDSMINWMLTILDKQNRILVSNKSKK